MRIRLPNYNLRSQVKHLIPRLGYFTNGPYVIRGFIWLKELSGIVVKSFYPNVYEEGVWVNLPEYHLKEDKTPQFKRIKKKQVKEWKY